jgi:hypothetical protein
VLGGGGWDKDGLIVRQIAKIPLINQREMIWRWIWVRDHPEPGAHTAVIYSEPWDKPPPPKTYRVHAKSEQQRPTSYAHCAMCRPPLQRPTGCVA